MEMLQTKKAINPDFPKFSAHLKHYSSKTQILLMFSTFRLLSQSAWALSYVYPLGAAY